MSAATCSAPDAKAQRAEQANARVQFAIRSNMPEPETITEQVPVFGQGEVVRLEQALHAAQQLLYTVEGIVAEIKGALNQADRLTARAAAPRNVKPPVTEDNRPTVTSAGPMKILRMMAEEPQKQWSPQELATLLRFSSSTMRTYIPILRDGSLVEPCSHPFQGCYGITPEGIQLVQNTPEE